MGGLYRDAVIVPSRDSIQLIPEDKRSEVRAEMAAAREARQRQTPPGPSAASPGPQGPGARPLPKRASAAVAKRQERDARTLYCGNLSYSLTEALLIDEFESVCGDGAVAGVRFSERRDCAWVELKEEAMAEAAVGSMHELEVLGRRMNVDRTGVLAKRRPPRK